MYGLCFGTTRVVAACVFGTGRRTIEVTTIVLLISPLVLVKLVLTSVSVHSDDSKSHLVNAYLSVVLASRGNPSKVKERDACFASSCNRLYRRWDPMGEWVSTSYRVSL